MLEYLLLTNSQFSNNKLSQYSYELTETYLNYSLNLLKIVESLLSLYSTKSFHFRGLLMVLLGLASWASSSIVAASGSSTSGSICYKYFWFRFKSYTNNLVPFQSLSFFNSRNQNGTKNVYGPKQMVFKCRTKQMVLSARSNE